MNLSNENERLKTRLKFLSMHDPVVNALMFITEAGECHACEWDHTNSPGDIVAYAFTPHTS